ncbi:MAG: 3'-5' exonuclease, partial [Candidatus Hydrogenedentes bacterium]|nr:3'-5' exonuclease [Candidatus Hydrogenedentota bacterium]
FREAKAGRASLDFSDLLRETVRMLEEDDALRAWTASGIKYLLIDEFQDTNAGQLALAEGLMALTGRAGAELFVVGDAKQSIYKFRGAEVEVFDKARALVEETVPLDVNYRSLPEVMGFINDFFQRSRALEHVEPDYKGMQTDRDAVNEPRVEFLIPEESDGANSDALHNMEAELIANRIAELCGRGGALVFDTDCDVARPADFGDVAVLFRRGTHIQTYARAFTKLGIHCNIVEGAGFYKKQEIADFRNLLQSVLDPWDETALAGFLRSPIAALKDETLMELCLDKGLAEAFTSTMAAADEEQNLRLNEARELVCDLRKHIEMPLAAFLRHALIETSYEAILLSEAHGVQKASNVRKLVDVAADFAHSGPARLRAFTRYLDDLSSREIREGEAELFSGARGAVKLMTIHKSKGLEFPIVVIADTAQGTRDRSSSSPFLFHRRLGVASKIVGPGGDAIAPGIGEIMKRVGKDEDRAEEARILYVAMTRARDWLLIGGSPKPGKGSWLRSMNDIYGLTGRADGDVVSGDGWQAVLRRKPGEAPRGVLAPKERPSETVEMLLGRAARLDTPTISHESITITQLLNLMQPGEGEYEETSTVTGGQELDPMLRGTMIHRLLELWDFTASEAPPVGQIISAESPAIGTRALYEAELNEAITRIERSEFFAQLQQAAGFQKELPFLFRLDDMGISGTIDARLPDGTIVDYKTGRHRPESHRRHETQLRLYAAALQAIEGTAPPKGVLFYVDSGETYEVDLSASLIEESVNDARDALQAAIA